MIPCRALLTVGRPLIPDQFLSVDEDADAAQGIHSATALPTTTNASRIKEMANERRWICRLRQEYTLKISMFCNDKLVVFFCDITIIVAFLPFFWKINIRMEISTKLVDIGANLGHPIFANDLDEVIQRAKNCGIVKIMVTGTTVKHSRDALDLANKYPGYLYATVGVHPHDAKDFTDSTIVQLEQLASGNNCVAIGKCGLDFNRNFSPPENQLTIFEAQVKLACRLRKPLFIHEREAHSHMVEILSKYKKELPSTVIHCFTGSASEAKKYIDMGFYIGLTGFLWKDRSNDGVKFTLESGIITLDRLLIETDAPFMYPKVDDKKLPLTVKEKISEDALKLLKSHCSFKRNEPCSLLATNQMIAVFLGISYHLLARKTTENAGTVYNPQL